MVALATPFIYLHFHSTDSKHPFCICSSGIPGGIFAGDIMPGQQEKEKFLKSVRMMFRLPLLLSALTLYSAFGWVAFEMQPQHPDYGGKCYLKNYRKALSFQESWKPSDECMEIRCSGPTTMPDGKAAFSLEYVGCGAVSAMSPCYVTSENPRLSYPECCPQIVCP
ncbi:unnamed protein product [Darwinula stevensoni]|uniref:Single domain-containing protein n=1 Tax=Darwinula stevensoni TaxID=69355 RepID=A0A7R8WYV5_9CRUS|nr:unnamed protein product [Darwinula stevensoni]CAG0879815.1 unnamed protein product [Darwinula stevensoni]